MMGSTRSHGRGHGALVAAAVLFLSSVGAVSSAQDMYVMLVGCTGDGKTFVCNKYDGTYCGRVSDPGQESSETSFAYIGQRMIDTPGFGNNTKSHTAGDDDLHASLAALLTSLQATAGKQLRAILWVVPCLQVHVTIDTLELMKLLRDIVGDIPVVALFNTGDAGIHPKFCKKNPTNFIAKAAEFNVTIREVLYEANFDLNDFEARYTKGYRVILPPDLQQRLEEVDPRKLASRLRTHRAQQCEALPMWIKEHEERMTHKQATRQNVTSLALCASALDSCSSASRVDDCGRQVCVEMKMIANDREFFFGALRFSEAESVCERYEMVQDEGCLQRNEATISRDALTHSACIEAKRKEYDACVSQRAQALEQMETHNAKLDTDLAGLRTELEIYKAKLNTCIDIIGGGSNPTPWATRANQSVVQFVVPLV